MKPKMEGGRGLGVGEVLKLSVLEIEVRKSHINVWKKHALIATFEQNNQNKKKVIIIYM